LLGDAVVWMVNGSNLIHFTNLINARNMEHIKLPSLPEDITRKKYDLSESSNCSVNLYIFIAAKILIYVFHPFMCFIFHSVNTLKTNKSNVIWWKAYTYTKQNTRPSLQVMFVVGQWVGECVETKHILLFYLDLIKASLKLQHVMRPYCSESDKFLKKMELYHILNV
jgi:hypothetical protein